MDHIYLMEFGGSPPPRNKKYYPTNFPPELWYRIENHEVLYTDDPECWKGILMTERSNIEAVIGNAKFDNARWFVDQDFVIRTLRSLDEKLLVKRYEQENDAQLSYERNVWNRMNILDVLILQLMKMIDFKGSCDGKPKMEVEIPPELEKFMEEHKKKKEKNATAMPPTCNNDIPTTSSVIS